MANPAEIPHRSKPGPERSAMTELVEQSYLQAVGLSQFYATVENAVTGIECLQEAVADLCGEVQNQGEMLAGIAAANNGIEEVSLRVEAAVNGATSISAEVVEHVESCRQVASEVDARMGTIRSAVSELAFAIQRMGQLTLEIGETLKTTEQIAAETGALARAAADEAVRAGDTGRGFDVIAGEVNRLAEQSHVSAQQIMPIVMTSRIRAASALKSLQACLQWLDSALQAGDLARQAFDDVTTGVSRVNHVMNEIRGALVTHADMCETMSEFVHNSNTVAERMDLQAGSARLHVIQQSASLPAIRSLVGMLREVGAEIGVLVDEASQGAPKNAQSYGVPLAGPVMTLDPVRAADPASIEVCTQLYCRLVRCDESGRLSPSLALAWETGDGSEYTFYLRKGAYFHDGREITSDDVRRSFERLLSPTERNLAAWLIGHLQGAAEFAAGKSDRIVGLTTPDPFVIRFKLNEPHLPFPASLAHVACSIVGTALNGSGVAAGTPVGSGPFCLSEAPTQEKVRLAAFERFFQGRPFMDSIEFTFVPDRNERVQGFRDGSFDQLRLTPESYGSIAAEAGRSRIIVQPLPGAYYAGFNLAKPGPWQDLRFRLALNLAIDRERLVREVLSGMALPSTGPLPPALVEGLEYVEPLAYDVARARSILGEMGFAPSDPLMLYTVDSNLSIQLANFVSSSLLELRVPVLVKVLSWAEYQNPVNLAPCHLYVAGWTAETGDPDSCLFPLFYSRARQSGNLGGFIDAEVDRLLLSARSEPDPERRAGLYRSLCTVIQARLPWIFLYHPVFSLALNPAVRGVSAGAGCAVSLERVWFESDRPIREKGGLSLESRR